MPTAIKRHWTNWSTKFSVFNKKKLTGRFAIDAQIALSVHGCWSH